MKRPINILTTFDQDFLQHAVVMLRSLFYNHPLQEFNLFIYTDNKLKTEEKLLEEFQNDKVTFCYIDFNPDQFPSIKTKFHYGENYYKIIYLRLNIGELLPDQDRILLLDTDLVIDGDITDFYHQDLEEDHLFAAVAEVRKSNFNKFGIEATDRKIKTNFNGGVLLIDLQKWRLWGASKISMNHIIKFQDILGAPTQDTLNPLFYNNWKVCSPKFNLHHYYLLFPFKPLDLPYSKEVLDEAISKPLVIHFSGNMRPWHYLNINPFTKKYWDYLAMTSFRDYKVTDRNLKNWALKYFRMIKVKLKQR
jgi:lipopolysaccharide biosynthesis glycosyltransferase